MIRATTSCVVGDVLDSGWEAVDDGEQRRQVGERTLVSQANLQVRASQCGIDTLLPPQFEYAPACTAAHGRPLSRDISSVTANLPRSVLSASSRGISSASKSISCREALITLITLS